MIDMWFLFCIFFHLVIDVLNLPQEWNFKNASYDLLNQENNYKHSYVIYKANISNYDISLAKTISKNGNEIKDINNLEIIEKSNNNKYSFEVDWEDINNIIYYDNILHICPQGKFHPFYFDDESKELTNHKMYNFNDNANVWELKCNLYNDLFIAVYSHNNFLYAYNTYIKGWNQINFYFTLYDLMWTNVKNNGNLYEIPGLALINTNNIALIKLYFIIDFSIGFEADLNIVKQLCISKNNIRAYFGKNNDFYFLVNDKDDSLLSSVGYYKDTTLISPDNISNIKVIVNVFSNFGDKAKIQTFEFIKGTRYAYYQINNNNKNYYGIFDILTNQILFNTNEQITKFIPYSKFSILAITKTSAYEICILSIDDTCVEKCDNDNIVLNPEGKNYCECPKLYFKPSYKCIDNCDTNFYIKEESKYCGLCKDLGGNKIYKLINTEGCLEEKPNNTIFYDEEKLLLTCDDKSHLENETCIINSKEEESKKIENEKEDEVDVMILIFIGFIVLVFIILSIIIFVKLYGKKMKNEDDLLNQVDTDFEPKNSSIN